MPDDLEIGGPPTDIPKEFASTSPRPIRPSTSELGMIMRGFDELKGRVERIEGADDAQKIGSTTGLTMSVPTRDEIDAKLAATEARGETRFVELSGKLDRVLDAVAMSNSRMSEVREDVKGVRDEMAGVKSDNKNTRWTIAVTVVAAVLAALAALWTTQSNLLSAFQVRLAVSQAQPATPQAAAPTPASKGSSP